MPLRHADYRDAFALPLSDSAIITPLRRLRQPRQR